MENEMKMGQKQIKVEIEVEKAKFTRAPYTNAPLNPSFCQSFGHGANSPKGTTKPEKNRG